MFNPSLSSGIKWFFYQISELHYAFLTSYTVARGSYRGYLGKISRHTIFVARAFYERGFVCLKIVNKITPKATRKK